MMRILGALFCTYSSIRLTYSSPSLVLAPGIGSARNTDLICGQMPKKDRC